MKVIPLSLFWRRTRQNLFDSLTCMNKKKRTDKKGEEELYYWENGLMVFTEAYHRRRGYCCKSGCRHCPYGFKKEVHG